MLFIQANTMSTAGIPHRHDAQLSENLSASLDVALQGFRWQQITDLQESERRPGGLQSCLHSPPALASTGCSSVHYHAKLSNTMQKLPAPMAARRPPAGHARSGIHVQQLASCRTQDPEAMYQYISPEEVATA